MTVIHVSRAKGPEQFRKTKSALSLVILLLWILCAVQISLLVAIRSDLYQLAQLAGDTNDVGHFHLRRYFPVHLPALAAVTCLVCVVSLVTCVGTWTNSEPLLGWYFFVLMSAFCLEVSLEVANAELPSSADQNGRELMLRDMKDAVDRHKEHSSAPQWLVRDWEEVQEKYACCGVRSFVDWAGGLEPMVRACALAARGSSGRGSPNLWKMEGCGERVFEELTSSPLLRHSSYVTIATALVQVAAMVLDMRLWLGLCLRKKPSADDVTIARSSLQEEEERKMKDDVI